MGQTWVGTGSNGVAIFDGINWVKYTTDDGLAGNVVNEILIDFGLS